MQGLYTLDNSFSAARVKILLRCHQLVDQSGIQRIDFTVAVHIAGRKLFLGQLSVVLHEFVDHSRIHRIDLAVAVDISLDRLFGRNLPYQDGMISTGYEVSGYTLISGSATVSQNGNVFTVNASSDCTVRINFRAVTYTVNATVNNAAYGSVSVSGYTITATPVEGY